MIRYHILVAAIAIAATPLAASAQDSVTRFRLAGVPGNIQGCMALEASMARVHTVTVKDGNGDVKFAGGINQRLTTAKPGVYTADFELSGVRLDAVADMTATPKTLTVTSKSLGCKWTGQPEPDR
jgi:hypothetical protein